jgi:hypothetical protein
MNSPYFYFAVWKRIGEEEAIRQFNRSIFINVPYDDFGLTRNQESDIRIWMYNPATQGWVKLGGRVDVFRNVVTGQLSSITPLEENGNALFTLAVDSMPNPKQKVNKSGETILSIPGRNDFRFSVLPGTVEVGSHFEVTNYGHTPTSNSFQLLAPPVDIKAYYVDHLQDSYLYDYEITDFSKPITLEFDHDLATLGVANLTIVSLQDGQWKDTEGLGYEVSQQEHKIVVETNQPGTFSLAIK